MPKQLKTWLRSFLIELLVYSALVCGYFLLVLRFLGGWLARLFHEEERVYAAVALLLIVLQGVVLEILTRALLSIVEPRSEE